MPTAAPGRKRKPQVVEQSAHVASVPYLPDTENEPDDNDDDETEGSDSDFVPIPGLEHDYDCALSAVNVLHSAGWQNPGELLLKVAQFAIKNPAMAKQMLTNL